MALREKLEILVDANVNGYVQGMDKAAAATKRLDTESSKLDRLAGKFTTMGAAAVGGASVAALGLGKLAQMAGEAQVAQAKLDNSIANSSQKFRDNGKAISDLADSLQTKTAADDESIRSGSAVLVQFGLTEDQVKRLTPLVVDLSRKMGVDMDSAAKAVGKSATGTTTALKRMGIDVQTLSDSSNDATATIEALSKSVGGFAQAEGRTFSGQVEILKNQLSELGESVGQGAAGTLGTIVGRVNDLAIAANDVNPGLSAAVGSFLTLSTIGVGGLGALSFAAGQFIKMRSNVSELTAGLRDAEGNLTRFGTAAKGVAVAGGIALVGVAVVEIANEFNKAAQNAEKFDAALRVLGGAQTGSQAQALAQSVNSLIGPLDEAAVKVSDLQQAGDSFGVNTAKWANDLGKAVDGVGGISSDLIGRIRVGSRTVSIDLNQLGEAVDKVSDSGNVAALKAFREQLDGILTPKGTEARAAVEQAKRRTDDLIKSSVQAAAAQSSLNAETERQVSSARAAGVATGEYAVTADDLKEKVDGLKVATAALSAAYTVNAAAAKGFSAGFEQTAGVANNAVDAAQSLGKALVDFRESSAGLPRSLDLAAAAAGAYNDEQTKSIDSLQALGSAINKQLSSLLATGAGYTQVQAAAASYERSLRDQLSQVGITGDAQEKYVELLGLTPKQVETQIRLSGAEQARATLELLQGDFDNLPTEKRSQIYALIARDQWSQALEVYRQFRDKSVTLGVNIVTRGAVQNPFAASNPGGTFFRAAGGFIPGYGSPNVDTIPAMLAPGEYVVRADAVQALGRDRLDMINQGMLPGYAKGGPVRPDWRSYWSSYDWTNALRSPDWGQEGLDAKAVVRASSVFFPDWLKGKVFRELGRAGVNIGTGGVDRNWVQALRSPDWGVDGLKAKGVMRSMGRSFLSDQTRAEVFRALAANGVRLAGGGAAGRIVAGRPSVPKSQSGNEFLRSEIRRLSDAIASMQQPSLTYVVHEAQHRDDPVSAYKMMKAL